MGEGTEVYGARFESLLPSERDKFNVESGVKVTDLGDGKFKDLGIRKGYILVSVNGKKVKSAADVRSATNNESSLKSIEGVQSDGTIFKYSFSN
jgi:S1-C subfamily serine protease